MNSNPQLTLVASAVARSVQTFSQIDRKLFYKKNRTTWQAEKQTNSGIVFIVGHKKYFHQVRNDLKYIFKNCADSTFVEN